LKAYGDAPLNVNEAVWQTILERESMGAGIENEQLGENIVYDETDLDAEDEDEDEDEDELETEREFLSDISADHHKSPRGSKNHFLFSEHNLAYIPSQNDQGWKLSMSMSWVPRHLLARLRLIGRHWGSHAYVMTILEFSRFRRLLSKS